MFEDLEGLEYTPKTFQDAEGINAPQTEYLAELDVESWSDLNDVQQLYAVSAVDGRMDELGIPVEQRSEFAHAAFSEDLADAYDNYIIEQYNDCDSIEKTQLEAPTDNVQIEQISEVITNCEEIKYENWVSLELSEKEAVLNSLEERIAEIEHRPACPVRLSQLEEGCWGGYNPETKDITINSLYADSADFDTYREIVDTLVHEGRHAYQDYNVNVVETHPRHSEVASWAETMEGGKWGYWGDCSSLLGMRLYEQQSIEIDARNFAADVIDKLNLNA